MCINVWGGGRQKEKWLLSFSGGKWLVIYCNNKGFLNKRRKTFEKIEKFNIFNFGCQEWAQQKKILGEGKEYFDKLL